jgi:pyrroloquinoline quinone biosynthesis protein B
MIVRILGSAAGGGLPQWNCGCPNCAAVRAGDPGIEPRSQSSVAVSADGRQWLLLNASPDIRQQIGQFSALGPPAGFRRGTPIVACILTDAELDHTLGLLSLREGAGFRMHCTPSVHRLLTEFFPLNSMLAKYSRHTWTLLKPGAALELLGHDGNGCGLKVTAFELPGHAPLYAEKPDSDLSGSVSGLVLEHAPTESRLVYAPGVARHTEELEQAVRGATCVLLDGTFWSDDELARLEISDRAARDMGHWPVGGPDGSLAWFARLPVAIRAYIHINNTNPMLREGNRERAQLEAAGIRVAADRDSFEFLYSTSGENA